ncbi:MAG TPA: hypothetical protein VMY05_09530 [Acidobacteriota bacterium]|nr:hypothetical protein [Acidobacteriota bacterium]
MTEEDKKETARKRITDLQRMKFIGFEVFPGKPKDLFKSEDEKSEFEKQARDRRGKGASTRLDSKLLEERMSFKERIVLAFASVIVWAALFFPWYSAYTEVADESPAAVTEEPADSLMVGDSALAAMAAADTAALSAPVENQEDPAGTSEQSEATPAQEMSSQSNEEILTGHMARRRVRREYDRLSGISSFIALGSVGSHVFTSGAVLVLTGIIFLLYGLLCLVLPALTLYCLFGLKGSADEQAVRIKKYLRFNWLPLVLFFLAAFLSFFGADYGEGTAGLYASLGDSYGPGVFLATLSWGVFITLAASILVAVKAVEI